ncbi:MAG: 1-acyl-sn-glycerol-3-phosphate acyltransferase [Clostridiaceae bacterium]|mgnify:CR=1 FL=1|nr:1-acyl-sn-glycerol-3-phosphate acyltransferase [Clostridiaceae bacterium]
MKTTNKEHVYYTKSASEASFLIKVLIYIVAFLAKILFWPVYHNTHYIPKKEELNESYFVMGNHSSLLDPVLLHLIIPDYVHWVAKKELFNIKILDKILEQARAIPLDRENVDINAMKMIRKLNSENKVIGLFPQGTRVDSDNYQEKLPEAGVASICTRYNVTILPVFCDGPYKLFRKNHFYFSAPFCLNPNIKAENKQERNQILTNEIVRRSYNIVGKSYFE